jgi:hypothetical protein
MQKEPIETLKVAILCVFEPLILHTETEKMMPKKKKSVTLKLQEIG